MQIRLLANLSVFFKGSLLAAALIFVCACEKSTRTDADLVLKNAAVYSYRWPEPNAEGKPATTAPYQNQRWFPDADAVAIKGNNIIFVGSNEEAHAFIGENTRVIDLNGATVLPGMVDSHTHVEGLGRNQERLDLSSARNEAEAVAIIAEHAKTRAKGEWIIARGWDEGAWAEDYPDMQLLSEHVPHHPVFANSLHGFAAWGNRLAFELAGITNNTPNPVGGEIVKDKNGNPNGLLMNNATDLLADAVPQPDINQLKTWITLGLNEMARSGFVSVHVAGVGNQLMQAFEQLEQENKLPLRVYAMISASSKALVQRKLKQGPDQDFDSMLITKAVKGYYDGALGSRGAKMLEDYTDRPGHRGVSGTEYGFDQTIIQDLMQAGFQIGIHAIGDAGNREVLDVYERILTQYPEAQSKRHRIEHAQVIHPDDFARFKSLQLIASMQPPHAAEDKVWAEDRIGPERIKGAYAWRSLRRLGVPLAMGSDLTGSDHNIFYGLHACLTRRSKDLQPPEGWTLQEALTIEEAIRGYTSWPAYAAFMENHSGSLQPGRWADITVMDIDPHNIAQAEDLFSGKILMTIVNGKIVYQSESTH